MIFYCRTGSCRNPFDQNRKISISQRDFRVLDCHPRGETQGDRIETVDNRTFEDGIGKQLKRLINRSSIIERQVNHLATSHSTGPDLHLKIIQKTPTEERSQNLLDKEPSATRNDACMRGL